MIEYLQHDRRIILELSQQAYGNSLSISMMANISPFEKFLTQITNLQQFSQIQLQVAHSFQLGIFLSQLDMPILVPLSIQHHSVEESTHGIQDLLHGM